MKPHASIHALLLLVVFIGLAVIAHGQPKDSKLSTKTEPSDKFGEGGTVTTTSNDKFQVTSQVWKDKNGKVRETYQYYDALQLWAFYAPEQQDVSKPKAILTYDPTAKEFVTEKNNQDYKVENVEGSQARQWIDEVETQFAKDGTVVRPWEPKTKTDTLEQPKMPPTEVFNKPKESKTESKSEEPKINESPKKEDQPKTDKTANNGANGNTASIEPNFTAPGYKVEVKTNLGLTSPIFTTPYGDFKINIPGDVQSGDPFSGTVWFNPLGKNEAERTKNARELHDYTVRLGSGIEFKVPWKSPGDSLWVEELYQTGQLRYSPGKEFLDSSSGCTSGARTASHFSREYTSANSFHDSDRRAARQFFHDSWSIRWNTFAN